MIALGEPNHGSHEVFTGKALLVRALVEHHGVDVVALEASSDTCEAVDEYVRGEASDLRPRLLDIGFWTWRTHEVEAMVTWLRDFVRRSGRAVSFVGLDPQLPVRSVERLVRARSSGRALSSVPAAELETLLHLRVGDAVPADVWTRTVRAVRELAEEPDVPVELLTAARRLGEALELTAARPDGVAGAGVRQGARDRIMAERALELVAGQGAGRRMVIWAHNAHVSRSPYGSGVPSMGSHLHRAAGADYAPVGMVAGAGRFRAHVLRPLIGRSRDPVPVKLAPAAPTTLEGQLGTAVQETCILDLRAPAPDPEVEQWLHAPHPSRSSGAVVNKLTHAWEHTMCRPGLDYDALVYLPTVSPSEPLPVDGWTPPGSQRPAR